MANNTQVFGKSAVLTLEPVTTSNGKTETINLELAPCSSGKADHRQKMIIQPTLQELPLVVCVFIGFLPAFRLARDGKWMLFSRQKERNGIFIKGATTTIMALPVNAGDTFLVTDILLSVLSKNLQSHPDFIVMNLRNAAALYLSKSLSLCGK